jgi:hypothetical protein
MLMSSLVVVWLFYHLNISVSSPLISSMMYLVPVASSRLNYYYFSLAIVKTQERGLTDRYFNFYLPTFIVDYVASSLFFSFRRVSITSSLK